MDASTILEPTRVEATGLEPAGLLAVAADPVRWRLLTHLAGGGSHCVCELQPIAAVAGNLLSYHLKVLREAGLVTATKRGRWIDYTITGDALARLHAAIPTPDTPAGTTPRSSAAPAAAGEPATCDVPATTWAGGR